MKSVRMKSKYRGEVTIEGKIEEYYVWAYTEAQATLLVAHQFNKKHKHNKNAFVEHLEVYKDKERS